MKVSSGVFTVIGVGYVFWTIATPLETITTVGAYFVGITALVAFLLVLITRDSMLLRAWLVIAGLLFFIWIWLPVQGWDKPAYAISILLLFLGIGILNAVLGTAAAGFTISSAVHSWALGHGLPSMFLWKDVFEFLHISSAPLMIAILVVTSLVSAEELLHKLAEVLIHQ